jgi:cytoskeletal protein CcmA (bactofilin family)
MFSKTSRYDEPSMPTIVSGDATVQGDMISDGDIQIEGKVTGDVTCKRLTLGKDSEVSGRVECESVHVHGAISGEIHAETVYVSATAHVSGDVHHGVISVEQGARVEGRLVGREPKPAPLNLVTDQTSQSTAG